MPRCRADLSPYANTRVPPSRHFSLAVAYSWNVAIPYLHIERRIVGDFCLTTAVLLAIPA